MSTSSGRSSSRVWLRRRAGVVGVVCRGRARVRAGTGRTAVAEVGEAVGQRAAVVVGVLARAGADRTVRWRVRCRRSRGGGLQGLPRALDAGQVRRLLDSCDRSTVAGIRDFAILTMLVRLGMRRGEVAGLRLDDIDWRAGESIVRGKGAGSSGCRCPPMSARRSPAICRDGPPGGLPGPRGVRADQSPQLGADRRRCHAGRGVREQACRDRGGRPRTGSGTPPRLSCCATARRCTRSASCCGIAAC